METKPGGRILVVDDERQIRRFLRISLASQGYQVIEAETGGEGLTLALSQSPDLVLLDLGLPDLEGQEVLEALRTQSDVPVIVVSVREREEEKVRALDGGANDYVTKPFGIQELLARVRRLLRFRASQQGEALASRFHQGELRIDLLKRRVRLAEADLHLTPKEYAVLEKLCRHAGRVVTQTQLLREIWGPSHAEDTHYLRIVVSRLRHKLGDTPQAPALLQTEAGVGYRLQVEPDDSDD
ncbi:response regulator [Halomonas sp. 328]|uniref:response regulator n=1 Tax=Halomonas sp. 328 TaxID=2776704 RepID=UPI0018A71F30|nr:response regulator transcription factor [Halomonas sp. 328]MBF8221064.1 response regulator transcription factor [Halomonas sp. 328]